MAWCLTSTYRFFFSAAFYIEYPKIIIYIFEMAIKPLCQVWLSIARSRPSAITFIRVFINHLPAVVLVHSCIVIKRTRASKFTEPKTK